MFTRAISLPCVFICGCVFFFTFLASLACLMYASPRGMAHTKQNPQKHKCAWAMPVEEQPVARARLLVPRSLCRSPCTQSTAPRAVLLVDTALPSGAQNCPRAAPWALCHQHGAGEEPSPAFSVPWGLAGRCCGHQGPRSTRGLSQVPHVRWPCTGDTASHPASSRINVGTARSSPPRPVVS